MDRRSHYDSEVFRLVVAGGFYHPDADARQLLRRLLDSWLSHLGETPPDDEVREIISSESGTVIEPFSLTSTDLDCAVFLARAAFSEKGAQTRFRVASRGTIGPDGGLVITNNLQSYYAERYIHGEHRSQPRKGWAFVPAAVPEAGSDCPRMVAATLKSDDQGFRIVVPLPECREDPAFFAVQLQRNSKIRGVKRSLSDLGLRIECHRGKVHVLSGSPESMIRLMAHMVEQRSLTLQGESSESDIPITLIRLDAPQEKPIKLPAMTGSTSAYSSWMTGIVPSPIPLKKKHKIALSSWLRPHPEWLDSVLTSAS